MKFRNHTIPIAILCSILVDEPVRADLVDGGFEAINLFGGYGLFQGGIQTAWRTTAPDNMIEVWSSGFNGVSAYQGTKFAELNANYASTLYQDVGDLGNGAAVNWHFAHRGRNGVDTMRLTITDLGANQVIGGGDDTVLHTQNYSAGLAWVPHYGSVTSLGNATRFAFQAISAVGGNTQGNFIDYCGFGTSAIPTPSVISLLGLAGVLLTLPRRR